MDPSESIVVLLVEDDPADQKLVRKALENQELTCNLHVAQTGEEALEYLERNGAGDVNCPAPDVILLDLNMPGMGGREFLRVIKADEKLCSIPVIILTTSDSETDIQQCYRLQASGYVQKPTAPPDFQRALKKVVKYWFLSALPSKH